MKKRYVVLIIVLVVLALGAIITKIMLGNLKQLAALEISDVDLAAAEDGIYIGSYSSFPVSAEVKVIIKDHLIVDIELLKHDNGRGQDAEIIPQNVVEAQSLKVDSVSGATYSSKVILKAIQNALLEAGG